MRRAVLAVASVLCGAACGGGSSLAPADAGPDGMAPTDPGALARTVGELAALGERRAGTPAGESAAVYLEARFREAGVAAVGRESFRMPRHDVRSASLSIILDGTPRQPAFETLEASGPGTVTGAPIVNCGGATSDELAGLDLHGKVALVSRSVTFHRSSQYKNVAEAGALAMLYISDAPDNLIQVGSVRRTFESLGPIPALSVGAEDGAALLAAAAATATLAVDAVATPAMAHNIVARLPGTIPEEIVVGAHFDSWFSGANDNAAGAAAVVALAARRARRPAPRHTLVFVAYDGEEPGLYGGYDYMHRHRGLTTIAALLGFEVPSPRDPTLLGFGRSNHPALDEALQMAGVRNLYPLYINMDAVPALFGGIIPTDIQGLYRDGVPAATTATSYAYYHTRQDSADRVDTAFLAQAVDAFDRALDLLDALPAGALAARDPALWNAAVTVTPSAGRLRVAVRVTGADGRPRGDSPVEAQLLVDDFFQAAVANGRTAADGTITLDLPDQAGSGRYLHVTAGPSFPLVETMVRL